jgi:hypothetical protein
MYRKMRETFSLLTKNAFNLNICICREVNSNPSLITDQNLVFLQIFSKICLNSDSLLKLIPKEHPRESDQPENFKIIDLSSVSSLTRDLIDANNILFYLFSERIEDSEREFRFLLYSLHGWFRKKDMFELMSISIEKPSPIDVENEIDLIIARLESNPFFIGLDSKRKNRVFKFNERKINKVTDAVFLTRKEITKIRQIPLESFDAIYMFCSNHIHSFAMGTTLTASTIIMDKTSIGFLLIMMKHASFYLSLGMIDASIIFPLAEASFDPKVKLMLDNLKAGEPFPV